MVKHAARSFKIGRDAVNIRKIGLQIRDLRTKIALDSWAGFLQMAQIVLKKDKKKGQKQGHKNPLPYKNAPVAGGIGPGIILRYSPGVVLRKHFGF